MSKTNRPNRYFSAAALSVIALWTGGRLKRALIKYLGGQYGIMTEFYSDWAYNAFHQFKKFRNASLLLCFLAVLLLMWLYRKWNNSKTTLYVVLLLFAAGCVISAIIICPSEQILHFIFSRACCFALYIIAAYTVIAKR
ncbi:MAG: hypothetical protein IJF25_05870 [Oscillospiraceae bacterium]|nr:hypothetical protein [Oscillospiraceae bacterium]MBQ4538993.1 hypothetical protein [Oscillospiraceae bacterium]